MFVLNIEIMNCAQLFIASLIWRKCFEQINRILATFIKVSIFDRVREVVDGCRERKINIFIVPLIQRASSDAMRSSAVLMLWMQSPKIAPGLRPTPGHERVI